VGLAGGGLSIGKDSGVESAIDRKNERLKQNKYPVHTYVLPVYNRNYLAVLHFQNFFLVSISTKAVFVSFFW
jgi:hypothetical protein